MRVFFDWESWTVCHSARVSSPGRVSRMSHLLVVHWSKTVLVDCTRPTHFRSSLADFCWLRTQTEDQTSRDTSWIRLGRFKNQSARLWHEEVLWVACWEAAPVVFQFLWYRVRHRDLSLQSLGPSSPRDCKHRHFFSPIQTATQCVRRYL